jgi:hypothetical protein
MAIATYSDLLSEIDAYTDRSYATSRKAVWVGNAEAKFNRKLTSSYRRLMDTTLTTDSTGLASLPSGFVGLRSIVRDVAGSTPLTQTSWGALIDLNPYELSEDATHYAIQGTYLKVSRVTEDDFLAVFDSKLTALSDSNSTNWLLALAPDVYLTMCLAEEALFTREFATAAGLESTAYGMLSDIVSMDQVAQFGNAELHLEIAP